MLQKLFKTGVAIAALISVAPAAMATESGADTIGAGSEGFLAGALPPAGFYGVVYYNHYRANRFNDGNGNSSVPGFSLAADVLVPRLLYMSDQTILGGRLGGFGLVALPVLSLDAAGAGQRQSGVGDTVVGPLIHWGAGSSLHTVAALDISMPTGSYDKNRALNLGKNYTSFRPIFAISYLPPSGFEASAKVSYTFNTKNTATDYTSGQLFHFDYSVSYPVSPLAKLGVNGYYIKQVTDDKQNGQRVGNDGFRGQVFAIGPAFRYQFEKIGLEIRALREYAVRNRPAGDSVWVKAVVPF